MPIHNYSLAGNVKAGGHQYPLNCGLKRALKESAILCEVVNTNSVFFLNKLRVASLSSKPVLGQLAHACESAPNVVDLLSGKTVVFTNLSYLIAGEHFVRILRFLLADHAVPFNLKSGFVLLVHYRVATFVGCGGSKQIVVNVASSAIERLSGKFVKFA